MTPISTARVMLLFFLLAGRFLDSAMRARAQDGRRRPDAPRADRCAGAAAGRYDSVAQRRRHRAGHARAGRGGCERIAVDGVVEEGRSNVDRSLVTGESMPESALAGSIVLAGTINLTAPLTIRATAAGDATAIADIARLMESCRPGQVALCPHRAIARRGSTRRPSTRWGAAQLRRLA